ncbi:MAG: hypothetical protein AAF389_05120 [Gemmatimonadota bacterium]
MDNQDVREPRRDPELRDALEAATPEPPFSEFEVAAIEARIIEEGKAQMAKSQRESRLRRFAYRVALPASLAAELMLAFRLAAPPEPTPAARAAEAEYMQAVALTAFMDSDVGAALVTGDAFRMLPTRNPQGERNDG